MKKTIAILLVLVIGMVGVWAADAQLSLTTEVPEFTYIYVTNKAGSSTETYAGFMANVTGLPYYDEGLETTVNPEATPVAGTEVVLQSTTQNVGKLHYMTNAGTGVSVKMAATHLSSTTSGNSNVIKYTVTVGTVSVDSGATATTTISDAITISGSETQLTIGAKDISVVLVQTDYEKAPADTYNGDVYFNFVTT